MNFPMSQCLTSWQFSLPLALIFVLAAILTSDLLVWRRLPPGPTPLPFVGNKYDIPESKPWLKFQEWAKQYGGIFTIWIGRRPTIIISDPDIAVDLLEKRSSKYSSRPRCVAMGEILWENASILVQPYGKAWSVRRKLLHNAMTPSALRLYKPTQEAEASRLCAHLLDGPDNYVKHIERFTSSFVFSIAYGHRIDSLHAKVIRQKLDAMHYAASLNVPGRYLVESFPIMKHIPATLAPWKREIQLRGRIEAQQNMSLVQVVKDDIDNAKRGGTEAPPSLCRLLLETREKEGVPLSDRDFSFVPASLFGAGSDTTASTLCSAFLALVTDPSALSLAQAELDAVVGPSRTPSFEDEAHLPYIRALCKEVLRWRPVAVLGGTPHSSTEDDNYETWRIPAGTTILGNSWAINLNEEYYPDPQQFNPVRFLEDEEAPSYLPDAPALTKQRAQLRGKPHPSRPGHSSFGWGRRICPGASLAENSLYAALSKILWGFDVAPLSGQHYDTFDYTEGFNIRPKPFKCTITARSSKHAEIMKAELEKAEEWLARFPVIEE